MSGGELGPSGRISQGQQSKARLYSPAVFTASPVLWDEALPWGWEQALLWYCCGADGSEGSNGARWKEAGQGQPSNAIKALENNTPGNVC